MGKEEYKEDVSSRSVELNGQVEVLRDRYGLSLRKLADDLGVNKNTVLNWQKPGARINIGNLLKLSQYFNVKIDDLIKVKFL